MRDCLHVAFDIVVQGVLRAVRNDSKMKRTVLIIAHR